MSDPIFAIDMFCGVGGMSYGLSKAGINISMGVDNDPACEFPFISNNNAKFLLKSVNDLTVDDIDHVIDKTDYYLLAACPPCQTFSSYNYKASLQDDRRNLILQAARIIRKTRPDLIALENVPGIRDQSEFKEFFNLLQYLDYYADCKIVNCADYGVPQNRRRLVLLASKRGPISFLSPNELNMNRLTVRDAIGHLQSLKAGEVNITDPLHQASRLSDLNIRRIKASSPGATWRDWDKSLLLECHTKREGANYRCVYGRMKWDEPSPTITTQFYGYGNGRFGHPEQDRALSLREGALLQSFPDDYKFIPDDKPIRKSVVGRLIGNAVPPNLGYAIGVSLMNHVN